MILFDVGDVVYWKDGDRYAIITKWIDSVRVLISCIAEKNFELIESREFQVFTTRLEKCDVEFMEKQRNLKETEYIILNIQFNEFMEKFKICSK